MIHFTKMHGLGNDFVVIDAINQTVNLNPELIRNWADRHFGIGFDQLLLVEKPVSTHADFKYRIFNADGSEVAQCGNGARCFARFVINKGLTDKNELTVDTNAGQLGLFLGENNLITVDMGIPRHAPADIPMQAEQESKFYTVSINDTEKAFGAVSLGNPHAVIQVNDVKTAPVNELGSLLENHLIFPERVNVGFMQIIDRNHIRLRVYERGAAETLACGSGACAAVVVGIEQNLLDHEVRVELPGGELTISWAGRGMPVLMTGPAVAIFDGVIALNDEIVSNELSSTQVEHYLQKHPEFFNDHLELLEKLTIPHPSGSAVSLISKQLELFRGRHQEMENQLIALIDIARDNDASWLRMHELTLALLDASTLKELINNLNLVFVNYFQTDFIALKIIKNADHYHESPLFIEPGSEALLPFFKELSANAPSCGRPTLAQARVLFGDLAPDVASCAIVPMVFTELEGLLAIGSRDPQRFNASMGNLFLKQMSELIGTRLISLLQPS